MEPKKDMQDSLRQEAQGIVRRLLAIQEARKLSDRQMVDEFPDLGSAKTWRSRLLPGTFEGLNITRIITKLRRIAAVLDGGSPDEVFFPDAPFALEMRARVALLERQQSDRRILPCLAANGCGKSSFARWSVAQAPMDKRVRVAVRVRPTWRNRPLYLCLGIARALGAELETNNPAEAEHIVIDLLRHQPRTVYLDQAHEAGVTLMHLLRAFVDETPSKFVYLAYATAYKRVISGSTDALIEAKAFMGRCVKPTFDAYQRGILPADVIHYLVKTTGMTKDAAGSVAQRITHTLQAHTNLRLLDDAIVSASSRVEDEEAAPETIVREVARLAGLDTGTISLEEAA
jgi:hypothetical protein